MRVRFSPGAPNMDTVYYFGCYDRAGHYLWNSRLRKEYEDIKGLPWGYKIDGGLCPEGARGEEGRATINVLDGWTALSFCDRSVDDRPGSNSSFIAKGVYTFEQMCDIAKKTFPEIWGRFKFKIVFIRV